MGKHENIRTGIPLIPGNPGGPIFPCNTEQQRVSRAIIKLQWKIHKAVIKSKLNRSTKYLATDRTYHIRFSCIFFFILMNYVSFFSR